LAPLRHSQDRLDDGDRQCGGRFADVPLHVLLLVLLAAAHFLPAPNGWFTTFVLGQSAEKNAGLLDVWSQNFFFNYQKSQI
jgi:hypothetical protein